MCTVRVARPLVTVIVTVRGGPAAVLASPKTTGNPSLARATGSMRALSAGCHVTTAPVVQLSETRRSPSPSASIAAPVGSGLPDADSCGAHTSTIATPGPPGSTVVPQTATGRAALYDAQPLAAANIKTTQRPPAIIVVVRTGVDLPNSPDRRRTARTAPTQYLLAASVNAYRGPGRPDPSSGWALRQRPSPELARPKNVLGPDRNGGRGGTSGANASCRSMAATERTSSRQ
jgi:hypothetical protein